LEATFVFEDERSMRAALQHLGVEQLVDLRVGSVRIAAAGEPVFCEVFGNRVKFQFIGAQRGELLSDAHFASAARVEAACAAAGMTRPLVEGASEPVAPLAVGARFASTSYNGVSGQALADELARDVARAFRAGKSVASLFSELEALGCTCRRINPGVM